MSRAALLWTAVLAGTLGAVGGGWWARRQVPQPTPVAAQAERKPLFYRHPMNPAATSPVPAKDEMGMDYVPVYAEAPAPPSAEQPRTILHYRHPMGQPDTSPVPKKDAMGMDYLPVYADGDAARPGADSAVLRIAPEKIQRLGVKTARAVGAELAQVVHSVGTVEADERRLYAVALRFEGYIEQLHVNTTGQAVTRGQPLFELYSPELVSAQREYLTARNAQAALDRSQDWIRSGMRDMAENSLDRLRNWGISEAELAELAQRGQVRRTLVVRSPATGVVMEKTAVAGARAMAGETLFKIADLSEVWVIAQVYEQDIGRVALGQAVTARLDAYPEREFRGRVGFIYPMLDSATRTARIRVEFPNPQGWLKPMMFAHLEIATRAHKALVVPHSAVLESGKRRVVLVDLGEGRFEPRPVRLGLRGEDAVEVLEGLREGESVVVGANFLIDAESNLKSALEGFAAPREAP